MKLSLCPDSLDLASLSDVEVIDAAMSGVQAAYTELVSRYQERLLAALRGDVSCSESADDIVQEAFVRAFRNLDKFRSESGFYTWLYRIAINSRRYYQRNRHRTIPLSTAWKREEMPWWEPATVPGDPIEARETGEHVWAALARLDRHHREILLLREFEGHDYQTISETLDLTLGTVRSRLSRARAQLRRELHPYWNGTG